MKEVRSKFAREQIAKAWVWKDSFNHWEFHGPNGEYFHSIQIFNCTTSAAMLSGSNG
jgi:hypothetical protein